LGRYRESDEKEKEGREREEGGEGEEERAPWFLLDPSPDMKSCIKPWDGPCYV